MAESRKSRLGFHPGKHSEGLDPSARDFVGQGAGEELVVGSLGLRHWRICEKIGLGVGSGMAVGTEKTRGGHLDEAARLVAELTRGEKAALLQAVVRDMGDAFPGVDTISGVCGGEPCIARTRIPVWLLEQARRLGTSEADLLRSYPTLRAEDLANAWAYARSHRDEIEREIQDHEAA